MCVLPERAASARAAAVGVAVGVATLEEASAWLFCSESGEDSNEDEEAAPSLEDEVEGGGTVSVEEEGPEEEVEAAADSVRDSVGADEGAAAAAGEEVDGVGVEEGPADVDAAEGLSMSTTPSEA